MTINRVTILTPPGAAAIAVVRIAGPKVPSFLRSHFSAQAREKRCVHGNLFDGQHIIDDPVIVLSSGGQIADINLHGGDWVIRQCIKLAQRDGFEFAKSTDDLLDADSMIEREMLIALPQARTEQTLRLLLDQPRRWTQFKQDIHKINKPALQGRVHAILNNRTLWRLLNPPRIAIIGAPNVGKSTLANQLFGQQRSITADIPGTTRDWIGDWANLDGLAIHLLDTPGQCDSADPIEQAAIVRSQQEIESADLKILVIDPTQPMQPQSAILSHYSGALIVINKADLRISPSPGTLGEGRGEGLVSNVDSIRISALTGTGLEELRKGIQDHFAIRFDDSSPHWWTDRQRNILTRAIDDSPMLGEL